MPIYKVKQYEDVHSIVFKECGTNDISEIMEHADNRVLFSTRSEYILKPGDELWIPEKKEGIDIILHPNKTYSIRAGISKPIVLKIESGSGKPLANTNYKLTAGQKTIEGKTDGDGFLRTRVPLRAKQGRLEISGQAMELRLSGLDPIHTITGIQGRLANLGYYRGRIDGKIGPKSKAAIRKFQEKNDLKVDGIVGPKTREKLLEQHIC